MSDQNKTRFVDIGFILLLGLTPLLWFEPGALLKALDFDLPLTWERLHSNFFYIWDYQNGAGLPRNLHAPALMFFLPEALLQKIGFSLEAVQRIFFCFWFTLPGLAFYYLMRGLLRGEESSRRAGIWVAVSFYMYNLYLEPIWLGFNMANLSAYVAVPLALGVLVRALEKQDGAFQAGLKIGGIFFLFSAMAQNPSIVLISAVPFAFLVFWHLRRGRFQARAFLFLGKLLFLSLGALLVFNAYWILPEVKKLFDSNLIFEASSKTGGNVAEEVFFASNWLKGISRHTSLLHVLKMQGDWPWYEGFRDYAKNYWSNPILILLAWFPFALAGVALWKTTHPYKWFFGILWMAGIVFSMGSHLPFGIIYLWLLKHLPLFWTIRSPWYKFTLLTCLGYGFLMGLGAQWLFDRLRKIPSKAVSSLAYALLILAFVAASPVYSYPSLLEGRMYRKATKENGYSNHFKIPPHVLEAARWLNERTGDARVWDLPSRGISYNTWGYEGFLPLVGYFIKAPLFCDNHPLHIPYQGAWGSSWMHLSKLLRNSMEKGLTPYLSNLMRLLRIQYVMQEGDFRYEVLPFPVTRKQLKDKLETLVGIKPAGKLTDAWDLWQTKSVLPQLYAVPKVSVVNETEGALVPLSPRMTGQLPAYLLLSEIDFSTLKFILEKRLIQEAVLFESSMLDWAVNGMDANYLSRFVNDPEKGKRQELFKKIEIKETGEYLILAKKRIPLRETPLRVDVDFTNFPQTFECLWNQKGRWVLQKNSALLSIKMKRVKKLLPFGVMSLAGIPWGTCNLEPLFDITNLVWSFELVKSQANPVFKMNGEAQFAFDPEIEKIFGENSSREWQYLGSQNLKQGIVGVSAEMTNRLSSQWDFFVVPKSRFLEQFRLAENVFADPRVGQVFLFATTSKWGDECKVEHKKQRLEPDPRLMINVDEKSKRSLMTCEIGGEAYECYQRDCIPGYELSFTVENPAQTEITGTVAFKFLLFQSTPATVSVRLNKNKIEELIAEPMEEAAIYIENVKFPPGKSKLEIISWSKLVKLGDVLGSRDPRRVSFGFRDLKIGEVSCLEEVRIPSERSFEINLYPFFGKKQTKEIWKEAALASSMWIDGKEYPLGEENKGTEKVFLKISEPVLLQKGAHLIKIKKRAGENYFLALDSPGEDHSVETPRILEPARYSPTKFQAKIQAGNPCFLVFCDAFDPKWEAKAGDQVLSPHFKVNGYANAFYFDGDENKNLTIEYIPQRHFMIGIWTTLAGGGTLLLLALFLRLRRKE